MPMTDFMVKFFWRLKKMTLMSVLSFALALFMLVAVWSLIEIQLESKKKEIIES
ncbi:hypothetical protein HYG93_18000 [Acinetobacter sp. SwsAc6]|uniref:hypothetical protein n=1 Tax=Acinetobacter TaxID=469 RepID=UPI0012DAB80E|nr:MULTISPECIES: hypothetical protein [Acinetobacter]NWK76109.1 hypothetical protein [Acinetobacter sp. SwsAc6]